MSKKGVVIYLHVHQPWRIREYGVFDTGYKHDYFEAGDADADRDNGRIFRKVAEKSYIPMNALLEKMLNEQPDFKVSMSISGVFIEQAERYMPEVLESFKRIVATGQVELVAETFYHSLAFFYSREEFERQVEMHRQKIRDVFGVETQVFRNTELSYNNELGKWADQAGFKGIMTEGWDPILQWRSPNFVYQPEGTENIRLLLKNYRLSDDIAFRFGNKAWVDYPLSADKYIEWLRSSLDQTQIVNLFMDYETFGEHQWADTGIFEFTESFINKWLEQSEDRTFYTVSEAIDAFQPSGHISMPYTVTWADTERDLTAWLGNSMQHEAMRYIYGLEDEVLNSNDMDLISDWRKLQTSDHPYYMCTKWFNDGDVHAYFSPYKSPYDAFLYFMNAMRDIRYRLIAKRYDGDI